MSQSKFPKPKDTPGREAEDKDESTPDIFETPRIRNSTKRRGRGIANGSGIRLRRDQKQFSDPLSYITKDGRVRLKGADYEALRRQAYHRAYGRCERITEFRIDDDAPMLCLASAPWDGSIFTRGHLAHKKHGPRKSDTLDQVIWSCSACHFAEHGPRWRKQRMEKAWSPSQFAHYYSGGTCICGAEKYYESAMCEGCAEHLQAKQPALVHVIQNGTGYPLLQAMGELQELIARAQ